MIFGNDPVERFLVDGQGRRLGFSTVTGPLQEILDSLYVGGQDGIGFLFGDLVAPVTLELVGLGGGYFAEVSGVAGTEVFGVSSSGILNFGEKLSLSVIAAINHAPVAAPDRVESLTSAPITFNVLANDTDQDSDILRLTAANVDASRGTVGFTAAGQVTFSPAQFFVGTAIIDYTVDDGNGGTATGQLTVAVPGHPRIIATSPAPGEIVLSLSEVSIDFSHTMRVTDVTDIRNYRIILADGSPVSISSVQYVDTGDLHQATIRLAPGAVTRPGALSVLVNGSAMHTVSGLVLDSGKTSFDVKFAGSVGDVIISADGGQITMQSQSRNDLGVATDIATGDFNEDGFMDLVAPSDATDEIVVHYGLSGGRYADPVSHSMPSGLGYQRMYTVDWNRDGHLDIVAWAADTAEQAGKIFVLLNDGHGVLTDAPDTPIPGPADYSNLLFGNFVGDVNVDVAAGTTILTKDRFLGYSIGTVLQNPPNTRYRPDIAPQMATGDFNEDGRPDCALCGWTIQQNGYLGDSQVVVWTSTANRYGAAALLGTLDECDGLHIADVTGDKQLDVVAQDENLYDIFGEGGGNLVKIFAGDGHGGFAAIPHVDDGRRATTLAGVEDLNGDQHPDLLVFSKSYVWWRC